ncbi:MAG TPA: D-2-hydroxyacid dehydrogenase [Thermoanaerobaculia bacterium]|nr:D-2-hydroxyacid dehydrogenase [Thermoanaerobaculia bacterium]
MRAENEPPVSSHGATRVLIPAHFENDLTELALQCGVELIPYDEDGQLTRNGAGARALFRWWLSADQGDCLIREYPLEWIHTGSAGVDHILTPAFRERTIVLTNSAGVHAPSIAEWVVAMILASEKQLREMFHHQRERRWEKVERNELAGKRILIVGGGRIATEIATRLRPFGVTVTALRRNPVPAVAFDSVLPVSDLYRAAKTSDWLVIAVPLTEETRGLIGRDVFEALPPQARLINVARGEVVDETAMLDALRRGRLAGAVLDVFDEEPLPSDHPFWTMESVVVLPHTTWRSPLVRARQVALFSRNLRSFARGEPLENVVDPARGY